MIYFELFSRLLWVITRRFEVVLTRYQGRIISTILTELLTPTGTLTITCQVLAVETTCFRHNIGNIWTS